MAWWVYKCNSKDNPYDTAGDWRYFFTEQGRRRASRTMGINQRRFRSRQLAAAGRYGSRVSDQSQRIGWGC